MKVIEGNDQKRPVVLIFTESYYPGNKAGGPIRSLVNFSDAVSDTFDLRIITRDRDLGSSVPYSGINSNQWIDVNATKVIYLDALTKKNITELIDEVNPDVVYLNSFFNVFFSILPAFVISRKYKNLPIVLAPRGEFAASALKFKSLKKNLFFKIAKFFRMYKNIIWQASTEAEAGDIKKALIAHLDRKSKVTVAGNVSRLVEPIYEPRCSSSEGNLKVCFLSRIVPIKNLLFAINVFKFVSSNVSFSVYGYEEDSSYLDECKIAARSLPKNIDVSFFGGVENSAVREVIAGHELFFVPTLGENYGHVFAEALSSGVPILLSDQTPWRHLSQNKVGWDLSLSSPNEFAKVIDEFANLSCVEKAEYQMRCKEYAKRKLTENNVVEINKNLFWSAIGSERKLK